MPYELSCPQVIIVSVFLIVQKGNPLHSSFVPNKKHSIDNTASEKKENVFTSAERCKDNRDSTK